MKKASLQLSTFKRTESRFSDLPLCKKEMQTARKVWYMLHELYTVHLKRTILGEK
jgi:hypothetical protein